MIGPNLRLAFVSVALAPLLVACSAAPLDSVGETKWQQDKILITYCCSAPPDEKHIAQAASENFNLIPGPESALKIAAKHGLKIMLEDGTLNIATANSPDKLKQLDALVERVKDDPALGAYYVFDEPQAAMFDDLARVVAHIKKRDPNHPCFINLLPIFGVLNEEKKPRDPTILYTEYVEKFIKKLKPGLLSYDYYNFMKDAAGAPKDGPIYFVHLRLMREIAQKTGVPFMNIIQASKFDKDWRMPTYGEMRWQVYTTLSYGGRGISYFLYWGPKKYGGLYQDGAADPLMETIPKLNAEIAALSPTLLSIQSTAVYQTAPLELGGVAVPADCDVQIHSPGPYLLGLFRGKNDSRCAMLVNRNYKEGAETKFSIKGRKSILMFDTTTSGWNMLKADPEGDFSCFLERGGGRLFKY